MKLLILLYVTTLNAEPFVQSEDYQQIQEVWSWLLDVSPNKPKALSGQIHTEIEYYSKKRGYLWPDNTKTVEATLSKLQQHLVNNKSDPAHLIYYYPSNGIIPYTAQEYRYLYDVTAGLNQSLHPPEDNVSTSDFLATIKLDTYFDNKHAKYENFLSNPSSTIYSVIYGDYSKSEEAFKTLIDQCTPSNKVLVDGKLKKTSVNDTFNDIAIAFLTLSQLENNYGIATDYRNEFIQRVEHPLKHITEFSNAYNEESGPWPENRRKYVDQCRTHFEEAGRLEVLIARSKQ